MSYFQTRYTYVYGDHQAYYRVKARQLFEEVARFNSRSIRSFLDLGCGCGDLAHAVHELFHIPVGGIEQDPTMVDRARKRGTGDFLAGNVLTPVEGVEKKYDLIGSFELFEHLPQTEHGRVLDMYKYYGTADSLGAILVPNSAHPLMGGWLNWSDYSHRSFFTAESLSQMLRLHGIQNARVLPWYTAGSRPLLKIRQMFGALGGFFYKKLLGAFNIMPGSTDPFVAEAFPLASHLLAVFENPS